MNVSGFRSKIRRKSISVSATSPSNFRVNRAPLGQAVDGLEADVVPGPLVLAARVAQADHQFPHASPRSPSTLGPAHSGRATRSGPLFFLFLALGLDDLGLPGPFGLGLGRL